MFILATFDPIKPELGLLLWTVLIFGLFWMIMRRFAFKPIVDALEKRDVSIQEALAESEVARAQMESVKGDSAQLLSEARTEQADIMKEARAAKDEVINEAKNKARIEANKIIGDAKVAMDKEKNAALAELKKGSGAFALEIAEKIIQKQLIGKDGNESFANGLINDIKLN